MPNSRPLKLTLFLLLFTLVAWVVYLFFPLPSPRTAVIVTPDTPVRSVGEVFAFPITLDNLTTPINAVQIDLGYSPDHLELLDFTVTGSFAKIFLTKTLDNDRGYARLAGGLPNPGYKEPQGLFATAYFRALAPGQIRISYLPTSLILANDGIPTNVITSLPSITLTITPDTLNAQARLESENQFQTLLQTGVDPDQTLVYLSLNP